MCRQILPLLIFSVLSSSLNLGCGPVTAVSSDAGVQADSGQPTDDAAQPIKCSVTADCLSENPCLAGLCESGSCVYVPNPESTCDDNNSCTMDDQCNDQGQCLGVPLACDDGDSCNGIELCVDGACLLSNEPLPPDGSGCEADGFCFARSCVAFKQFEISPECALSANGGSFGEVSIGGLSQGENQYLVGINYCKVEDDNACTHQKNVCRYAPDGTLNTTGGPWAAAAVNSIQDMDKNLIVGLSGEIGFFDEGLVNWSGALRQAMLANIDDQVSLPDLYAVSRTPYYIDGDEDGILEKKQGGWAWFVGSHRTANGSFSFSKPCIPEGGSGVWSCTNQNQFLDNWPGYQFTHLKLIECEDFHETNCSLGIGGIWSIKAGDAESSERIEYYDLMNPSTNTTIHFAQTGSTVNALIEAPSSGVFIMGTNGLLNHCRTTPIFNDQKCHDVGYYFKDQTSSGTGAPSTDTQINYIDGWADDVMTIFLTSKEGSYELWFLPRDYTLDEPHKDVTKVQIPVNDFGVFTPKAVEADPVTNSILVVGSSEVVNTATSTTESVVLWSTSPVQ